MCAVSAVQGGIAQAKWGFPGGFGGFCWGGWGVGTAQGDIAKGMGLYAQGLGFYEKQTAEARSIDTDTVMHWNNFIHESQMNSNRLREQRQVNARERNTRLTDERQKRLRDNPEPRGILNRGDALNAALDEIDDPRVYARALQGAKIKIGDNIRQIPFRYASAAITFSIHQLTKGPLPASLLAPSSLLIAKRSVRSTSRSPNRSQKARTLTPPRSTSCSRRSTRPRQSLQHLSQKHPSTQRSRPLFEGSPRSCRHAHDPGPQRDPRRGRKRPDATLGELLNFMMAFNLIRSYLHAQATGDLQRALSQARATA